MIYLIQTKFSFTAPPLNESTIRYIRSSSVALPTHRKGLFNAIVGATSDNCS